MEIDGKSIELRQKLLICDVAKIHNNILGSHDDGMDFNFLRAEAIMKNYVRHFEREQLSTARK
jgi:hypothetical protein